MQRSTESVGVVGYGQLKSIPPGCWFCDDMLGLHKDVQKGLSEPAPSSPLHHYLFMVSIRLATSLIQSRGIWIHSPQASLIAACFDEVRLLSDERLEFVE